MRVKILKGPKSHADLIIWHNGKLVCVEIKGKSGTAARSDSDQCRTWMQEVISAQTTPQEERDEVQKQYAKILEDLGVPNFDFDDPATEPIEPSGLLIINTHRNKPLSERPIDDTGSAANIPPSMHRNVSENQQCALTGLQFLGLYLKVIDEPDERENVISELLETVGVYGQFQNWKEFLKSVNSNNQSADTDSAAAQSEEC